MDGDAHWHIRFGSKTGEYYREKVEFPFFLHHLKWKGDLDLPEATVFETGSNKWRSFDHWPPKAAQKINLYFHPKGKLFFSPPVSNTDDAFDFYLSDPDKPVPFSAETRTSQGHLWMVEDQRFAASRPDVLVYESDILEEDITIAGPIHVV
jgi:predicted acyl esterase